MTRWKQFWHSYIENGLCDPDRCKTMKAMRELSERIPEDELERIPPFTAVFAPSAETLGLVNGWFHPAGQERSGVMIYLSPRLEKMPQSRVDSIVAHEFAHSILRHQDGESFPLDKAPKYSRDLPSEIAADKLIEQWGYTPTTDWKSHKPKKAAR